MKLNRLSFEGSPEEFSAVGHLFGDAEPKQAVPVEVEAGGDPLTVAAVDKAFNRRPLSDAQKALLRVLYENSEEGILLPDIAKGIGLSAQQVAGVRGALGRRVANTEGWPEGTDFCTWEWEVSTWRYWPRPAVVEAISSGKVKI